MAASAAHLLSVQVKAADAGWGAGDEVDGINDVSYGPSRDLLESTDFKDTSAAKTRFAGLKDGVIELSGDYEAADAPQLLIRTSEDTGADLWVWIKWNGIAGAGHKVVCQVESFTIKGSVDGKVEFTASLKFVGAPAAA